MPLFLRVTTKEKKIVKTHTKEQQKRPFILNLLPIKLKTILYTLTMTSVNSFDEAVEAMRSTKVSSNDDKLALYKLFKQATVGDCTVQRPGFFDITGKTKWDAWNGMKGTDSEAAKKEYLELANRLLKE